MSETIGFVGLGNMGHPMAHNLLKAGFALRVFDIHQERAAPLVALGASQAKHLFDVAVPGDIVFTMVPDDAALLDVALGKDGLLERLCPGGIHLSLSTISPELSEQLAELYTELGGTFLAAAVLGRPDVAASASLSIFLSGHPDAKKRVMPLLRVLGKQIYDMGENVAMATVVKLAANSLILDALVAMGGSAAFVERYGGNREQFLRIMAESPLFGGAVYEGYGQMIGRQDYREALFSALLGIKDTSLILEAAERIGLPMPVAHLAYEALLAAQRDGRENEDWSVLSEYVTAPQATTAPLRGEGNER